MGLNIYYIYSFEAIWFDMRDSIRISEIMCDDESEKYQHPQY